MLSGGAVPAIFPGSLVNPVVERQLTAAGWAKVVGAARADAAALRPALDAASQLTKWRDAADGGSFHGLMVRPLLPGDGDPCEGLV